MPLCLYLTVNQYQIVTLVVNLLFFTDSNIFMLVIRLHLFYIIVKYQSANDLFILIRMVVLYLDGVYLNFYLISCDIMMEVFINQFSNHLLLGNLIFIDLVPIKHHLI
jgi:hypothetical protein